MDNKKTLIYFDHFFSVIGVTSVLIVKEDQEMISDLTIYLAEPILSLGSTVIVIPHEVEPSEWREERGFENPAISDRVLDTARSIDERDRRLGVVVSSTTNVVRFNFPRDGNFRFAFAPLDRENASNLSGRTKLLRHGEGTDVDPVSGREIKVPRIMVVHVIGSESSEEDTLTADNKIKFVGLEYYYRCNMFDKAIACDATEQLK